MKCPHCGREIANGSNGHDFALEPAPAKTLKPKSKVLGEGKAIILMPAIGGEVEIRESVMLEWEETYPAVDVASTLREIRQWLLAHENRRKVNVRAFVNTWLKREQDRG